MKVLPEFLLINKGPLEARAMAATLVWLCQLCKISSNPRLAVSLRVTVCLFVRSLTAPLRGEKTKHHPAGAEWKLKLARRRKVRSSQDGAVSAHTHLHLFGIFSYFFLLLNAFSYHYWNLHRSCLKVSLVFPFPFVDPNNFPSFALICQGSQDWPREDAKYLMFVPPFSHSHCPLHFLLSPNLVSQLVVNQHQQAQTEQEKLYF